MDVVNAIAATIRWDTICSVTGDCTNIPHALSLLQSDDPVTRKSAYWMLDNHVIVQGGLFEGAFYVVPFLLQVCNCKSANGRNEAMTLLFEIASGASTFESQVRFATIGSPYRHYTPDPNAIGIPLAIAVRLAVACGLPTVANNMASENEVERKNARELLALFPEYASGISELLRPIAEKSSNQQTSKEIYGLIDELRR